MGMTQSQEIPKKPEEKESWSFRRLFPMSGVASNLTKTFSNPFEVLLGYLVLVVGFAELLGRHVSWFLWVFTTLMLLANVLERYLGTLTEKKPEKTKLK